MSTPQALNRRGSVELEACRRHAGHRARLLVEVGVGIDEGDELAAAQHELVERVLGRLADVARVDEQQDVDVLVDRLRRHGDRLHVEVALQLVGEHPGLGALARHRVEALAQHRQRAHQRRSSGRSAMATRAMARDQVVLEQPLALRREHRDRLLAVELAHREAEVELLAREQLLRLDAVELRRVLLLGVGLRVVASRPRGSSPATDLNSRTRSSTRCAKLRSCTGIASRRCEM